MPKKRYFDKIAELKMFGKYHIDSNMGGSFTVEYYGTSVDGDHLFNIINEGWEQTLIYSDGGVLRNVYEVR